MSISRNLSFLAEGVSSTGVLGASNGGSGASTLTGYLYGNGTSAFTASTTIPTSALSGTISNAQLANSSLSVNGTSISLGGSGTVTAAAGTLTGTTLNSTVVTSSLTSVGTLTSGTWNASTIGATYGGTGQNTVTTGDLLYGSATNTWSKLAIGSTGTILRVVGGVPTWGTDYTGTVTSVAASVPSFLSISGSPITTSGTLAITYSGTALPIANGGTAQTSFTSGQLLYGSFSQSSNLYWDSTNNRLSVGIGSSPSYPLDVYNTIRAFNAGNPTGSLILGSNAGNSSSRNWGLNGNYNAFGDFGILQSNAQYGDPISAGTFRMYFSAAGGVSIGNTTDPGAGNLSVNGSIKLGSGTPLTTYQEGTWTPTQGAGLTVVGTFSSSGTYTRIGRQVTVSGSVNGSTSVSAAANQILAGGLPFTANGAGGGWGNCSNAFNVTSVIYTSSTNLYLTATALGPTTAIYFSITYFV